MPTGSKFIQLGPAVWKARWDRVVSVGVSGVPGLERRAGLRSMAFRMGLGDGSQVLCTAITMSFNGDCGLIPCQVVGMRRTGERAGGQYQGIYPERVLPAAAESREGKGLLVGKLTRTQEHHRGSVEG